VKPKGYCCFCGGALTVRKDTGRCSRCQAVFRLTFDRSGCLLRLEVQGCGTPECCQLEKRNA